jgi:hypothetical protein
MDYLFQDGGKPKAKKSKIGTKSKTGSKTTKSKTGSKTTKSKTGTKTGSKTTKSKAPKKGGNFLGAVGDLVAPTGWGSFATAAALVGIDRADAALRRRKNVKKMSGGAEGYNSIAAAHHFGLYNGNNHRAYWERESKRESEKARILAEEEQATTPHKPLNFTRPKFTEANIKRELQRVFGNKDISNLSEQNTSILSDMKRGFTYELRITYPELDEEQRNKIINTEIKKYENSYKKSKDAEANVLLNKDKKNKREK